MGTRMSGINNLNGKHPKSLIYPLLNMAGSSPQWQRSKWFGLSYLSSTRPAAPGSTQSFIMHSHACNKASELMGTLVLLFQWLAVSWPAECQLARCTVENSIDRLNNWTSTFCSRGERFSMILRLCFFFPISSLELTVFPWSFLAIDLHLYKCNTLQQTPIGLTVSPDC